MSSEELVCLPIAQIRLDGGTQVRERIDEALVEEYAERMQEGDLFPPPIVLFDETFYWLADGFHRLMARLKLGKADIECRVFEGTQRDAVLVALKANSAHGLRRSNSDKIRAVQVVLADQEWSKKSTRWIAEICGVSRPFVEGVRGQLATVATHQEEGIATRVCQDGKRRSVRRPSTERLDAIDKALHTAGQFDSWLNRLKKLGEDLERLARGPGGTYLGGVFDRLYEQMGQIMCQVSAARPAARCQFCRGKGCDRCQQHGWLPAGGETTT